MTCSHCGAHDTERSYQRWYDSPLIKLTGRRRHRCFCCRRRFWVRVLPAQLTQGEVMAPLEPSAATVGGKS